MIVGTGIIKNGKLVVGNVKTIDQKTLTSDCWLIQFTGLEACDTCDQKGKRHCGGGETLKRLQAAKEIK